MRSRSTFWPSCPGADASSQLVTPDMTRESVTCGPDVDAHVEALLPAVEAGFDEVYVATMGPHYAEMIAAYGEHVLPALRSRATS